MPLPPKLLVLFLPCTSLLRPCTTKSIRNTSLPSKSVQRVQQHTVEQIVHVPIPQIQEQFVKSVQVISRERISERIEELIVDIPVPLMVEEMEEVVQIFLLL